jgi:hypothetical protein
MRYLYFGISLFVLLLIPLVRAYLESVMTLHMLIQLPLLVLAGGWIGKFLVERFGKFFTVWNGNGIPGIILFVFITMYWMIPRAMDDALTFPVVEVFKYISLPIAGILFIDSWKKIKGIGRTFVFLNYLSMFVVMGWLYIDSPIQMCNNYLLKEQQTLGWAFVAIALAMVIFTLVFIFSDHSKDAEEAR